jgi:hypothetical protein
MDEVCIFVELEEKELKTNVVAMPRLSAIRTELFVVKSLHIPYTVLTNVWFGL